MYVLEHRYCSGGPDGVLKGCTIKEGRARAAMTVDRVVVRGKPQGVRVTLGDETIEPGVGATALEPPRTLKKGDPLALDFSGHGVVELVGRRARKGER